MINCCLCSAELEDVIDTTFSNYDSGRAVNGEHTGDIYWCEGCQEHIIDDFLNQKVSVWDYSLPLTLT